MANSTNNIAFKKETLNILENINKESGLCDQQFENFKLFKKKWNKVLPIETGFASVGLDDYAAFEENITKLFVSIYEAITETINKLVWFDKEINLVTQNEIRAGSDESIVLLNEVKSLFEKVTYRLDEYAKFYADGEPHYEDANLRPDSNDRILELTLNQRYILRKLERVNEVVIYIKDLCKKTIEESQKQEQVFNQEYITRFNEEKTLLIKQFENDLNNLKEKYDNSFKGYKLELEGLTKSADLLRKSLDNGLKEQTQLLGRIEQIELEFSKFINDKTDLIDGELNNAKNALSSEIKSIKQTLYSEEKTIKDAHKDFINLVGKAGIYELTENYNKKAIEEKEEYQKFRNYTAYAILLAIGATVFIFWWAYHISLSDKFDYLLLIARLSVSLMFFVLAYYLSKQSAKHYECYQENHRTFLQLAALEPFMEKMDKDEQKTIRKGLIPTYFNQNADGKFAVKGEEIALPIDIKAYAEKLIDVGKNLLEKTSDQPKSNGS